MNIVRRGPFTAQVYRHPGKGGWTFARIPSGVAPPITRGWGRTPVSAVVDGHQWQTSIWRSKDGDSVLALPARVRGTKSDGDTVTVEFSFEDD